MISAFLPVSKLPTSCALSIAKAAFIVEALIASPGNKFIFKHARLIISCILKLGQLPGLKSDAIAIATPLFISSRAGAYFSSIK